MGTPGLSTLVEDYTALDFETLRDGLIAFAQRRFPNEKWTDFNDANFGTFLIELLAEIGERLAYTQNARFLETIPILARREGNFIRLAKSLSFAMKEATSGSVSLRIYNLTDPSTPYSFPISSHQQFGSDDGTIFQPLTDLVISSASLVFDPVKYGYYVDIDVTSGQEIYQENLATSDGKPSQVYPLSSGPLLEGTLLVLVNGAEYTEVSSLVEYGTGDKVFTRAISEDGDTVLTFGDGVYGVIPPTGSTILATYKIGTGTDAQLPPEAVNQILSTSDGSEVSGYLTGAACLNLAKVSGAGPRQTLDNAKQSLPAAVAANNRGVSLDDYAALVVKNVPGVLRASSMAGRYIGGVSTIILLIVPQGLGEVTASLYNQVVIALRGKKSAGRRPIPTTAVYVSLKLEVDVFIRSNYASGSVVQAVKTSILDLFDPSKVDFAPQFALQTLYDFVTPDAISGVLRIFVRRFSIDPYMGRYVTLGTTGNGVAVGLKTNKLIAQRREWNVRIVTPQAPFSCRQFEVRQRQMGTISMISDTTVTDEQGNYVENSLVGWSLVVRPLEGTTPKAVVSNTQNSITVAGGLLLLGGPDEPYVVEFLEARGKVLTSILSSAAAGSNVVQVDSVADWTVGDNAILVDASGNEIARVKITIVGGSSLTLDTVVTAASGSKIHYLWKSADGQIEVAFPDGATAWVVGDEFYVDTYPEAGDLLLRPENYVTFDEADLVLNSIGGIKLWLLRLSNSLRGSTPIRRERRSRGVLRWRSRSRTGTTPESPNGPTSCSTSPS